MLAFYCLISFVRSIFSFVLSPSTCRRMMSIEHAAKSVVYGAAKLTISYVAVVTAFQAFTEEN